MNLIKDNFRAAVTCVVVMCFTFLIYTDKVTFEQTITSITAVASGYFFTKKQEAERREDKERQRANEAETQLKTYETENKV